MQVPYVAEARRRGLNVVVTDANPNCACASLADEFYRLDTYAEKAHECLARELRDGHDFAAVLTAAADVGPTVSRVAQTLGLIAEDLDVARRARNKAVMRTLCDFPHPVYFTMPKSANNPDRVWERLAKAKGIPPYPCIVKPLEECASRGSSLVRSNGELVLAVQKADEADRQGHAFVLVEEALTGPEVAMDFLVEQDDDGVHLVFANAAWRLFRRGRFGIEAGHINPWGPWDAGIDEFRRAVAVVAAAANRLGVTKGPFKADMKRDPRYGWCILETATRLSGGFDHVTTSPLATRRAVVSAMFEWALTGKVDRNSLAFGEGPTQYACAYAPEFAPGKIKEWKLPDASPAMGFIVLEHDEIKPSEHCATRPLFIIALGTTGWEALKNAVKAGKLVEVEYASDV